MSTRKVKAITEELCGYEFSADASSQINQKLDAELQQWAARKLDEDYPYLILDARYEKVREDGVIRSRAVLAAVAPKRRYGAPRRRMALGINWEGRRRVLAVELANRESATSWKDFLLALKARGLSGVLLAISDDHPGLKKAIAEVLPAAAWQRCYVHFLRNALDYLPRKADDDCLTELRWLYDRRDLEEARRDPSTSLRTGFGCVAGALAGALLQTVRVGGGQHRGDLHLLSVAARTPQTSEKHEPAGAAQRRAETAHARDSHLPQRSELSAFGAGAGGGATRRVVGRRAVPGDGTVARTTKGEIGAGGLTRNFPSPLGGRNGSAAEISEGLEPIAVEFITQQRSAALSLAESQTVDRAPVPTGELT